MHSFAFTPVVRLTQNEHYASTCAPTTTTTTNEIKQIAGMKIWRVYHVGPFVHRTAAMCIVSQNRPLYS